MNKQINLNDYLGVFKTKAGACFPGDRAIFRGKELHKDFYHADWMELFVFGITQKRLSARQVKILHALWVYTSYPDARLWNNRVAALAGTARSSGALGISAAIAVSEATIYGWQAAYEAADFLERAKALQDKGKLLADVIKEELAVRPRIRGWGRPVGALQEDERIPVMLKRMEEEGEPQGEYLRLAFAIEKELSAMSSRPLLTTFATVFMAVSLDVGMSAREAYLFLLPCFLAGMPPCYQEACEKPEGATFVLPCSQLKYSGPARRNWSG
ncbi:hypothetical protein PZA18_22885 [Chitinimonas sp. DQS-5]|uniref:Citryl-CoA lyase n=2 Tax=Parachitinimonas caeni TaxID=3031301 RepID=A0ABT7E6B5_9NEIS|nr:hypothetical protein [Parachitinimonas caeni]